MFHSITDSLPPQEEMGNINGKLSTFREIDSLLNTY